MFIYWTNVDAQKFIYIYPSDTIDKSLGFPNGYIEVEIQINDSLQTIGTFENFTDSMSFLLVNLDTTFNMLANYNELKFTYYNARHNCFSDKITYNVDTQLSDSNNLHLLDFNVHLYNVYPDSLFLCNNGPSTVIPTDIPMNGYQLFTFSDLFIDSFGYIHPQLSIPGIYDVIVESEYCFDQIEDSTIIVTILDTINSIDVPDTLYYCLESDNSSMPISKYRVIGVTDSVEQITTEIASGYYEVVSDNYVENICRGNAITWVELIPSLDLPLISSEEFCDRVVLTMSYDKGFDYFEWSDGSSNNTIEVTQSEYISIQVTDEYGCLSKDSIYVEFQPLDIESVDYIVTDADCWTEGAIQINSLITNKFVQDDQRRLLNTLNGAYINDLDNISEGIYRLEVSDSQDCTNLFEEDIIVKQKCIEDYPVFSPNQDGLEDEYFIPHEGSIKIFDRNGTLLNEFNTPAYWDGTDLNGNQLPMGNYVIITDDNKPVNITLIK